MAQNQEPSSPDITSISGNLHNQASWETLHALHSDHLPILISLQTKFNFRLKPNCNSFTNYLKANWQEFTKFIEDALATAPEPTDSHRANQLLTNTILAADKRFIPKGRRVNKQQILPEPINNLITQRNNLRRKQPQHPLVKELSTKITKEISDHKATLWQNKLKENWDHRTNTHKLWQTLNQLSNKSTQSQINRAITFNNKPCLHPKEIASNFNRQFTCVTKHQSCKTNRNITKTIHRLPTTLIEITNLQVWNAINTSKNNKSTGPDSISIHHLKHLGPLALTYLTKLYNLAINSNSIPDIWKLAKIVPIPKPNKDLNLGPSYRPISLLSPIAKTLEKAILPTLHANVPNVTTQHGFKAKHSTTTALQEIHHTISSGFNQKKPAKRTIAVTIDMSKAFDTVNHYLLLKKLLNTETPPTIIKFISNYLKGRKSFTLFSNHKSNKRIIRTGVPQGGVLSPILFNLYLSDLPNPPPGVNVVTYADDITPLSSHHLLHEAQNQIQPYLTSLHEWTSTNHLHINPDKCAYTIFTTDSSERQTKLNLTINNVPIPPEPNPKILGVTFDPLLTFNTHIKNTIDKTKKSLNIIKAIASKDWGKQKETLVTSFNAITKSQLEYGCTVWGPSLAPTNMNELQKIQNTALRIATGCTKDTNIQHLHDETEILPIKEHIQLHSSLFKQKAFLPTHPSNHLNTPLPNNRFIKQTTFNNHNFTYNIQVEPTTVCEDSINSNCKEIHSTIVRGYLHSRAPNKIISQIPPPINKAEQQLPRKTRCLLAQLRTNKSSFLLHYLNHINPIEHPSPLCPACKLTIHDTNHLFNCSIITNPSNLTTLDLWSNPSEVAGLLDRWRPALPHLK
jgi:hypothetical protein